MLLAKKQLKMEGMIRKLLVQQQEADSTIAELSQALDRLDPAEKDRINLHDMTAAVRANKKKSPSLGIQHLNGQPQEGSLRRHSPWHIKADDCDIAYTLHPDQRSLRTQEGKIVNMENNGGDLGKSKFQGASHPHLNSRHVKSLVAPASLFKGQESSSSDQWNITASPNNNPSNILKYQDPTDMYIAPKVAKHMDSSLVTHNITKWGSDEATNAWEKSSDRWRTQTEDVHGYEKFNPSGPQTRTRPVSALSHANRRNGGNQTRRSTKTRPMSAMANTKKISFGDTDPELKQNPALWTGSGYKKEVYERLGQQNCEMHGRTSHDPELVPPKGF